MAYLRKIGGQCLNTGFFGSMRLHTSLMNSIRNQGSAGIIVIGDEILKGRVADTNSHFIAQHLFDIGIKVHKISVIGDNEDEISEEVKLFSEKFSYVITTGGIGPTHDDVTYSAIAKSFGEAVIPHPDLVKICSDYFSTDDLNSPAMKLAHVPKSAKLTFGYDEFKKRRSLYPNVSVQNVYIFPGIPSLMERLFLSVYKDVFKEGSQKMHVMNMYLSCTEVEFADHLNVVVSKYPKVTFGSYPKLFNRFYKVNITIQSPVKEECENAYKDLMCRLPKECIVNFDDSPTNEAYRKILNYSSRKQKKHVQQALEIIDQLCASNRPSEICAVFNGDPESVVVAHLLHACLRKNAENTHFNAVSFVENSSPFEVQKFIHETQKRYKMNLEKLTGSSDANVKALIDSVRLKGCKTVFVGSVSDSRPNVQLFSSTTDEKLSTVKWINPLENWSVTDVWDFIYSLYLPYSPFHTDSKIL